MSKKPPITVDEKWTWENCGDSIQKLKSRPEFAEEIRVLGYRLKSNGTFIDEWHGNRLLQQKRRIQYLYSILTYYANATPLAPKGKWIKFNQLEGGIAKAAFSDQIERKFKGLFDQDKILACQIFVEICKAKSIQSEDFALVVEFLPNFPVAFIYYPGDEEVSSEFKIFFDAIANNFLPTEICDFLLDIFATRFEEMFRDSEAI